MSYDDLCDYLELLKGRASGHDVRIDWSIIDRRNIFADQHHRLMGLQIADAVASGMWYGVEVTRLGFTEPRYARMLLPTVYKHGSRHIGNGIKFWPLSAAEMTAGRSELAWIEDTYQ